MTRFPSSTRRRAALSTLTLAGMLCPATMAHAEDLSLLRPSPPPPLPILGEGRTQAQGFPFSQYWEKGAGDEGNDEEFLILLDGVAQQKTTTRLTSSEKGTDTTAAKPPEQIIIQKFQRLKWSPKENILRSQGGVQIVYGDPANGKPTTLTAQDIQYDTANQQIEAKGSVQLERDDATLTGQEIKYNFASRSGYITEAMATGDGFRMRGKRIETGVNGSYSVYDGVFTTCERGRPDYQIRARRLTLSPNRFVSARHITLYVGRTPLISLPSFRRNLNAASQLSTPLPGYSVNEGIVFRLRDSAIAKPNQTLDYDVRVNFRHLPAGNIIYQQDLSRTSTNALPPRGLLFALVDPLKGFLEQLSPPTYREYTDNRFEDAYQPRATLFAILQTNQFVFNRRRNDLRVARYPEIGVRFANLLGSRNAPSPDEPLLDSANPVRERIPNAPFLLDVTTSFAALNEQPTRTTGGRFALRANLASQPLLLGERLSLRVGATNWFNLYTQGGAYNLFSPEVEMNYLPTRTSLIGVGYRYATDRGRTPFLFDRRDLRHELRLRYQVNGPWAFGVVTRYDLERMRAYDSEFAIVRNLDCMQVGLAYRARSQSFNIIFNLLPPLSNREKERRSPLQSNTPDAAQETATTAPRLVPDNLPGE